MKRIAVICAHPDDEALGCGGTILKHKALKDEIAFLWMTDGIGARLHANQDDIKKRNQSHQKAIDFINPDFTKCESFSDNELDLVSFLNLVRATEDFIKNSKPDIIYTHFYNDLNIDHALTCRAVMTATRPGSNTFVKEIYSFEVPSSTEWAIGSAQFTPDTYVNISDYIDQKKQYLDCYSDEMREYPHPRSIENIVALNQMRGAHMNLKYAEAFVTLRRVIND